MKLQLILDDARAEGREEGREEGYADATVSFVERLAESLHITQEEAMNYLKLSDEERFLVHEAK